MSNFHLLSSDFDSDFDHKYDGKAVAVIGANFGDEGKGAVVDALASAAYLAKKRVLGVRFNGGPQASHTVEKITPVDSLEGPHSRTVRHAFSSLSSVSLITGASSFFDSECLISPEAFLKEYACLAGANRILTDGKLFFQSYHPEVKVITPYDICLNQVREILRGFYRHGSCGFGIGVTMERNLLSTPITLSLRDCLLGGFKEAFDNIGDWVYEQIRQLDFSGQKELEQRVEKFLTNKEVYSKFEKHIAALRNTLLKDAFISEDKIRDWIRGAPLGSGLTPYIIYEGAQGLLLDQNQQEFFPHVTWSNTGLDNVISSCTKNNLELTEVVYVTRPYLTRHGAGGFRSSSNKSISPPPGFEDKTNVPNPYQGSLAFGELSLPQLKDRIEKDFRKAPASAVCKVAVTCLDQCLEPGLISAKKTLEHMSKELGLECFGVAGTTSARKLFGRTTITL